MNAPFPSQQVSGAAPAEAATFRDGPVIAQYLGQTIQAIEGAFLSAGDVLSAAVGGVGELIAGLDRLAAAIDPSMVAETAEDLRAAAQNLHDLPEALARRRAGLERLIGHGGGLGAAASEMKRSLSYLRVFATYVKVAAAGIREEGQQFTTFADEIADCIRAGKDHLDALEGDLEGLEKSLRTALRLEGDLAIHCADILPATPNAIVSTASALGDHREKVANATKAVAAVAVSVRSKVGGVLAALQVGDMTRQRLEHVQLGLGLLETLAGDLAPEARARFAAICREFLSALLTSASDDFDCEIQMIGRNMSGLAADAAEILRLLEAAYGRADDGEDSFLGRLETHVADALGLVDEVQKADAVAARLGLDAVDAAFRLNGRVGDIQQLQRDVQQMALNTRIKCSQVGPDGRSLAVIALELRAQATQLETSAGRALSHIGELEAGARELASAAEPGKATARSAADALGGVLQRLQDAGQNLEEDQGALARLGVTVVRDLQAAASGIDFKVAVGASLDQALSAMAGSEGGAQPCTDDIAPQIQAFLADLARSYTMAQERNVHQVVAAALAVPCEPVAAPAPPAEEESLDDLLF